MEFIQSKKIEFAEKEILFSVFQGALMRGYSVYDKKSDKEGRERFRVYLSEQLKTLGKKHHSNNKEYVETLTEFQSTVNSSKYTYVLEGGQITFGRIQKLLNLYLKYLWAFDIKKDEPIHCPIDSIILGKINWGGPSWTKREFTKIEYVKAVEMCREKAKNMSVAEWELVTFKNRSDLI